jgi:hypothetical protein
MRRYGDKARGWWIIMPAFLIPGGAFRPMPASARSWVGDIVVALQDGISSRLAWPVRTDTVQDPWKPGLWPVGSPYRQKMLEMRYACKADILPAYPTPLLICVGKCCLPATGLPHRRSAYRGTVSCPLHGNGTAVSTRARGQLLWKRPCSQSSNTEQTRLPTPEHRKPVCHLVTFLKKRLVVIMPHARAKSTKVKGVDGMHTVCAGPTTRDIFHEHETTAKKKKKKAWWLRQPLSEWRGGEGCRRAA